MWIEINRKAHKASGNRSPPAREVWIEIWHWLFNFSSAFIAPLVGAWVEIFLEHQLALQHFTSPPLWGCEVKFADSYEFERSRNIASIVGAWVEIGTQLRKLKNKQNRLPCGGVSWNSRVLASSTRLSFPFKERELKYESLIPYGIGGKIASRKGGVNWNLLCMMMFLNVISPPAREVWIEIIYTFLFFYHIASPPAREVWIEINPRHWRENRLPQGRCELKFVPKIKKQMNNNRLPQGRCELKWWRAYNFRWGRKSPPLWGRELKSANSYEFERSRNIASRKGGVNWNSVFIGQSTLPLTIASIVGAWIENTNKLLLIFHLLQYHSAYFFVLSIFRPQWTEFLFASFLIIG